MTFQKLVDHEWVGTGEEEACVAGFWPVARFHDHVQAQKTMVLKQLDGGKVEDEEEAGEGEQEEMRMSVHCTVVRFDNHG